MEDYINSIKAIMYKAKDNLLDIADAIYQQGYEAGKADTPFTDTEEAEEKAYNRGLADAWDAARKFIEFEGNGGYSPSVLREMFGETPIRSIFKHNTAAEALAKIKAYEDKQKQDTEIKVGDEVITKYKDHAVAVRDTYYIGEDREPFTLIWFGTHMSSCRVNELSKTGKHYPQISEIMAELRGAESDSQESKQVIDLSKPNSHLHEPLFSGLSWTARDFDILGTYLGEGLISYIEDKNGPLEDDCMKRLLEMKDECSEIYAASAYAKELSERLKLRKEQRENRKSVVK